MGEEQGSTKIVETAGVVGGKPRIAGTRIQVADVVAYYTELGGDIERIAYELDLTPQQVLAALQYYYDHAEQVRDILRGRQAAKLSNAVEERV